MRNSLPGDGGSPTPVTPQLQGPPNYPGPGGRPNLNPPFDPRMLSTGGANPALKDRPIKRGRIVAVTGGLQVNFMFNPTTLDVALTYDGSQADPEGTDKSVTAATFGEGQLSLNLLFDRTYEVWDRSFEVASVFGVHADVLAFYAYLGLIDASYTASSSWEQLYPRSQIQQVYSYLYVGDRLKYFGYISAFSVSYTHWSYDMIPTRAAVGISFNVVLTTPANIATIGSSSSSTTTPNPNKPQEAIPGKDYPVLPVG
jgi:hypothetical protein